MTDPAARRRALAAAAVAVAAAAAWAHVGPFGHELLAQIAILAIFAMSLDLLVGFAGMVSLGHAAFFGLGAYAFAALTALAGWPPWSGFAGAAAAGFAAALAVGVFAVRLTGVFFIMVTLAVGEAVHAWMLKSRAFGGDDGMAGIPRPDFAAVGADAWDPAAFSAFVLLVAAGVWLALETVVRSPYGRVLGGIRENAGRVRALGGPVARYRLGAFAAAGAVAGLAGALSAAHAGFVSPDLLHWTVSGEALIVVIAGGMGSLVGPVLGAAAFELGKHWLSGATEYWMFFLGLFFVAAVLVSGRGLWGLLRPVRRGSARASRRRA